MKLIAFFVGLALLATLAAGAGSGGSSAAEADVIAVQIIRTGPELYRFHVTVRHFDQGWEHYANRWEIIGEAGETLAIRKLTHPHVDEQPFTRSLSNVHIPAGVSEVTVRAFDLKHEYGGAEFIVRLPQ